MKARVIRIHSIQAKASAATSWEQYVKVWTVSCGSCGSLGETYRDGAALATAKSLGDGSGTSGPKHPAEAGQRSIERQRCG